MRLNAQMLYEVLSADTQVTLLGEHKAERTLCFPCFYDGEPEHLVAGGVYLAEREHLPHSAAVQQDILWVTWSGELPQAIPHGPVLFFHQERSSKQILNLLQGVFSRFSMWKEQLWDVLEHGSSVKRMIEVSEPLFSHPLCVVDSALNYLGYSASFMSKGREIFFPDDAETVPDTGAHHADGGPAAALFYDQEKDRIARLSNRDFSLGTLYMIHSDRPFSQTEEILFELLAEKLCQALQNLSLLTGLSQNSFRRQLELCFQTGQVDEERLYQGLAAWDGRRGDTFLCYKVKASYINRKINAEYICSIFENALNGAVAFWNDGVLVVLVDVTLNGCRIDQLHAKMEDVLRRLRLKAGVSLPFTELPRAWSYFRQACCAFEEGYHRSERETLYFFQNHVGDYMLHHAQGEFSREFLLDMGMRRLVEHDSLHAVSYLNTLRAFFACGMNMSQTAHTLGIHRTSLNARMQRIWECLEHEPTQPYLLYLQMILAMLEEE